MSAASSPGLFGSLGAARADDWDMKINGWVAQLVPKERRAATKRTYAANFLLT
jgi:hypothetical protein